MKSLMSRFAPFGWKALFLFCLLPEFGYATDTPVKVENLRCQGLINPIGIDEAEPLLGWTLSGSGPSAIQQGYQVLVASSPSRLTTDGADVWNSGRISGGQSQWVKYGGPALASRHTYYWKVLVWRGDGGAAGAPAVSPIATFGVGFLHPSDWTARWIGLDTFYSWDRVEDTHSKLSARYFRKTFSRTGLKAVKQARLYFTGLGLYQLYLNGRKVGDQELAPTVADYKKHVYYQVFDLTKQLSAEKNCFGVVLGNGRFFSPRPGEAGKWREGIPTSRNFGYPKMILQLEIDYTDGSHQTVVSDSSWRVTADGPIRSNNEYDGEVFDPTKEMPGWNTIGFTPRAARDASGAGWRAVDLTNAPEGLLARQPNPDMRVMKLLTPTSVRALGDGRWLVDMGQNIVGWVELHVKAPTGGPIELRYAERLQDDGKNLYTDNLRSARVKDSIAGGARGGLVRWRPAFVYHGFRYVEVKGVPSLSASDIQGQMVFDEMATSGNFGTSDSTINHIFKAAWWTIAGNYKGMPTDCPQRDERMGWLGDRSINCLGESFVFDNYYLYSKWVEDIADAQKENGSIPDIAPALWNPFWSDNMTWPSTFLFASNMLYHQYGDKGPVVRNYDGMKRWMARMKTFFKSDSLIYKDSYGDWCMPPESKEMILSKDSTRLTSGGLIASAYYIECLRMMTNFSVLSGHPEDSAAFSDLRTTMIAAVNRKYFHEAEGYYANNTITSNLLALAFGIVPPSSRAAVAANVVKVSANKFDNHVGTGLVGNQWLMRGLTDNGYSNVAYKIATNTSYPSWGYMLESGSTTIWELWNGNTANPAMNSGNHVMLLGDLLIWYYERLAGIKAAAPGFQRIEMKPLVSVPLEYVDASHASPYGKIESHWKKKDGGFHWEIGIPGNCTATVYVPASGKESVKFAAVGAKANGGEPKYIGQGDGYFVYELLPGKYVIESKL